MSNTYDPNRHGKKNFDPRRFSKSLKDRASKQKSGGKPMSIFRFKHRFKPPSEDYAVVRLIPEDHVDFAGNPSPYYEFVEHFHAGCRSRGGKGRSFICSRSYREDENQDLVPSGKCIPCYEREEEGNDKQVNFRRLDGFLLLHLDWYYLIPATDKDGKIMTYDRDTKFHKAGDTIFDRVHVDQAIEELGRRVIKRERYEKVFGKLMHWSMGVNHLLSLTAAMQDIRKHCKCGGKITEAVWECRHCGAEVLDLTEEGRENLDMTKKEIAVMTDNEYECACGQTDLLLPVLVCDSCEDPEPLSLWEVNIEVSRQGEGTQSVLVVHGFSYEELPEEVIELIPDRNILQRVFAADSLDYQAKALKRPNPWTDKDPGRRTQDYDEDPPTGGEEGGDEDLADDLPF